jgi:hypothetical protein
MAEWKRILISGSDGSFTNITASNLPELGQAQVLGIDGSGNITKFNTSSIATANAVTYTGTGGEANKLAVWNTATALTTASNHTVVGGNITIGSAEDSDYTDGLFTDFSAQATPIGTAIDRFNEVLNGLAPPSAPDVRNLEGLATSANTTFTANRLSFGSGVVATGYISASGTGSVTPMSTAVNNGGLFTASANTTSPSSTYYRLGIFTASRSLTFDINESTTADAASFTNYPADAFSVPADGGESYIVEINNQQFKVTTTGTSSFSNANNFSLSAAQTGSFKDTGLSFVYRRHRTGTLTITSSFFQRGWNYVKVIQSSSMKMTNYADWVFDPAQAGTSFSTPTNSTHSFTPGPGTKWISGIPYYTALTFIASGSVPGFYSCSYNSTAITFSSTGTSGSVTSYTPPAPTNFNSNLEATSSFTFGSNARALNNPISVTYTATGVQGKTTTQTISTPTIIIHTNTSIPTTKIEYFTTESQRVPSASYDTTASLINAVYNAATSLGTLTSELAFFDNALVYPSVVGNMSGAVYKAGIVPDYSGLTTGTKYLYRRFVHDASQGAMSTKNITISWTGMNSGFVKNTTGLAAENAHIHIKIPESTGYRDLLDAAPTSYLQFAENIGCGDGAAITNGTAKTINMRNQNWPASDTRWLVRITATTGWTGRITQITVT